MTLRNILRGADDQLFVEDVFSTFLYTGNGSTQTITNGIDLAGRGGLVWIKPRSVADNFLFDTLRGVNVQLLSNATNAQATAADSLTAFNANGFTAGANRSQPSINYASWTFRRAPRFFDVVTYTGNGTTQNIAHSLGTTPGMIIVKCTNAAGFQWSVYHRGTADPKARFLVLNTTDAVQTNTGIWNNTAATSTQFSVGAYTDVNTNGNTYVAYLFAHDATATGIVQCGTATAGATVTLGWEPQWVLVKDPASVSNWFVFDSMRGMPATGSARALQANSSSAEADAGGYVNPTATGFVNGVNSIYLAIRRGPMRRPTAGTQVYSGVARTGTSAAATITGVGFPPDSVIAQERGASFANGGVAFDRLRGATLQLATSSTSSESTLTSTVTSFNMDGVSVGVGNSINGASNYINSFLRRAPGFFDVVCYTGTGSAMAVAHNLTVTPELMIVKGRSGAGIGGWQVYTAGLGATKRLFLEQTAGEATSSIAWNDTAPTSTAFTVGTSTTVNNASSLYVAYLFASLPGVSKIGTYTGNGSSTGPTVSTGFQPRFLLVKRTDSTGNWVLWDSARDGSNPRSPVLFLNSTAAETTSGYDVDFNASDFQLKSTNADVNASGGTYLYFCVS